MIVNNITDNTITKDVFVSIKRSIYVTLQVEGFHNFEKVLDFFPEVGFLKDRHRHMFHFKLYKRVKHNDRDVEFILFKREVQKYLHDKYGTPAEFGSQSCEMLALELAECFDCYMVDCSEDNENGGIIEISKAVMV